MEVKTPLKDTALSSQRIGQIAEEITAVYPAFDSTDFIWSTTSAFPTLELKARIAWTAATIRRLLPDDFRDAVRILLRSLPATAADAGVNSDFGSFKYAPHSQMIAVYGCTDAYLDTSLLALRRLTTYYTAEDAIRYFINAFPDKTLAELQRWTGDPDHRVRRLTSEGTRPKLPWSPRIITPPEAAIPILDRLAADDSRFVTTSVANHVNDISTVNPELALALLQKLKDSGQQLEREIRFITNRALRTLVKTGYKPAFEFLGHSTAPRVTVSAMRLRTDRVCLGDSLDFEVDLVAHADERLAIDYVLISPNKTGTGQNVRVFKLKVLTAAYGDTVVVAKSHVMRSTANREVRPGRHTVAVQVNGTRMAEAVFDVVRNRSDPGGVIHPSAR